MPQLRFLQAFVVLAFAAVAATVAALPVGARLGARAGRKVLRAGGLTLAAGLLGSLAWGVASGEWAVFWRELGFDAVVQIGAFVAIVYFTGHNFVSRYLEDKAARDLNGGAADA